MNVVQNTTKYGQHKNRPFSCSFVYKKSSNNLPIHSPCTCGAQKTALAKHTNDTAARLEPPIVSTPTPRPYEDYGGGEHPSLLATQCKSAAQHTKTHTQKKNIRSARIIRSTRERAANNTFQVVSRNLRTIKRPFRTSVGRTDAASVRRVAANAVMSNKHKLWVCFSNHNSSLSDG